MPSKKGIRKKLCPLLEGKGVLGAELGYAGSNERGESLNWIKSICRNCPLWDEETQTGHCIYERPGRISKEDRIKLEEVAIES